MVDPIRSTLSINGSQWTVIYQGNVDFKNAIMSNFYIEKGSTLLEWNHFRVSKNVFKVKLDKVKANLTS